MRFGTGTGALRRQGLGARTLPLPLLTLTLLVRRERVRERDMVRLGIKSVSSSPSGPSEGSAASLSPDSLPSSSSDSPVIDKPGGLDDPGTRGKGTNAGGEGDMTSDGWTNAGPADCDRACGEGEEVG